jgi:hypothetical protein
MANNGVRGTSIAREANTLEGVLASTLERAQPANWVSKMSRTGITKAYRLAVEY